MALTAVHGKSGNFQWNAVDLSDNIASVSFPRSIDEVETTTFGASAKTFVVGLTDNKLSLSGMWDQQSSKEDATLAVDFAAGTSRTWIFGPAGSTAGYVKYTGTGYITNYTVDDAVADAVKWKAEIRVTGAVTRTTF